jgi:uncharacterized membrane protein YdbT with pleckstrin-like domain
MIFYSPVAGTNQITWRKHWWILFKAVVVPALFAVVVLVLLILVPIPLARLLMAMLFLASLLFLAWQIVDWYNDVYIITDDRIVDIEKVPLISEDRREARLVMIQDVNYRQPDFLARTLGYGDIIIETAAKTGAFTFSNVPNPQQVQMEIFARWERTRQPSSAPSAETTQEFITLLDRYHEMKHKTSN